MASPSKSRKYPPYLTKRRQGFYAILEIPTALRPIFGRRFLQSLNTREQKVAEKRLPIVVARWKTDIEKARGSNSEAANLMWEIMEWRKAIAETEDDVGKEAAESLAYDWIEKIAEKHGVPSAQEAVGVIFNNVIPLQSEVDLWLPTVAHLKEKTQALQKLAVDDMCAYFRTSDKINKDSVREYLHKLRTEKELSDKTIGLKLTFMRSFITFIDDKFGSELLRFFSMKALSRTPSAKTAKQRAWVPFTAAEVSKLYQAALDKKRPDQPLVDLIAFGAYTGCRIEEIGKLKAEHFTETSFRVQDAKTAAGIREVPLHPALRPLTKRLLEATKDGYLWEGDPDKFGNRNSAVGKRFGNLKRSLGFSEQHVFHSIRKTVVSQLEHAGVSENTTADIVGHDKPRITYGLYSSGASLKQKSDAIAQVAYDGALATPC